jgi:hypothetical protein
MTIDGLNIEEVMALAVLREWCQRSTEAVPSHARWYRARLRERFGAGGQLDRVAWLERVGRGGAVPKNDSELAVLRAGLAQVIALIREPGPGAHARTSRRRKLRHCPNNILPG